MKLEYEYPIYTKIITISNEPCLEDFNRVVVGTISKIIEITKAKKEVIVYTDNVTNHEHILLTKPMYYSEELYETLLKLEWWERWNIFCHGKNIITKDIAERKEQNIMNCLINK